MNLRRSYRRTAGFVASYFSDKFLENAKSADGRSKQGRRWKNPIPLIKAVMLGLAAGCKGLLEVEELTSKMFKPVRVLVKIPKRIADTTLRNFLCKLDINILCDLLYIVGYDAWRRKAIRMLAGFPFHVMSLDGKYPSISDTGDYENLQVRHDKEGNAAYSLLRTITSTLVTAVGRPIMGVVPVSGKTNEQGSFKKAFGDLVRIYGKLFQMVMYDAGAASLGNAQAVIKAGKDYLFQIADTRWHIYKTLAAMFNRQTAIVRSAEVKSKKRRKILVRFLSIISITEKEAERIGLWKHTRTVLKVENQTYEEGGSVKFSVSKLTR